jgi:hypothetical protein
MSFLFPGRFPQELEGICARGIAPPYELPLGMSLTDAMYIWWKIYKIRYTYSWGYSGSSVIVNGYGSVVMDGGIQNMSNKVCSQEITYSCSQKVHYINSEDDRDEDVYDSVYLTISSDGIYQNEEDLDIWYPSISLVIYPGNPGYDFWNSSSSADGAYAGSGLIDFFGLGNQYIVNTSEDSGYAVSISLSVEEESLAQ